MRLGLTAMDWQREVVDYCLNPSYRFLSLMAGRRAGKTFCSRTAMIVKSLSKDNQKVWYVSPTYGLAREQFDEISAHPALVGWIRKTRVQPHPKIVFKNGSEIAFRSFERPKSLRGFGLDFCWVDEIQDIKGEDFWPTIRPMLSDKRGTLVVSGQHRGIESWYYKELYIRGKDGIKPYKSWQIPSSMGMVYQSEEGRAELELARTQVPRIVWEVEYMCLPMANDRAVFRHDDIDAALCSPDGHNGPYVIGYDLGRVADPSAHVVIDCGLCCVVDSGNRPIGERHEIGAQKCADLARRYGNPTVIIDSTGGATGGKRDIDSYVKYYRQVVSGMREYYWNYDNKRKIIENLALGLEQGKLTIHDDQEDLIKQLNQYEYKITSTGRIEYSAPSGAHDDLVSALAMAYEGYRRGWFTGTPTMSSSII